MLSPLDSQTHYVQLTEGTRLLPASGSVNITVQPASTGKEDAPQPSTINHCSKRVTTALGSGSTAALGIMTMAIGAIVGAWDHPDVGVILLGSGFGLFCVSAGLNKPAAAAHS